MLELTAEGYTQNPASLHSMDERFRALDAWLREACRGRRFAWSEPPRTRAFAAIFVFSSTTGRPSRWTAPPEREDSQAFVHVAACFEMRD
jgi:aminoglycoside/choline kinase family phosphotransferase